MPNEITAAKLKARVEKLIKASAWDEAESGCRRLCDSLKASTPTNEMELAMAMHQLAFVLEAQGKLAEAEAVREQTSEILLTRARRIKTNPKPA